MANAITEALIMMLGAAVLGGLVVYFFMRQRYKQLSEIQRNQERQLQQAQEQARHFLHLEQDLLNARLHSDQLMLDLKDCENVRKDLEAKLGAAKKPTPTAAAKDKDAVLARIKEKAAALDFDTIGVAAADQRDDLKRVKGIGPFIEEKLNALGIYTFQQVANFTDKIEDEVNEAIEFFPGRIKRDNWKGQAAIFAKEKEEEKE